MSEYVFFFRMRAEHMPEEIAEGVSGDIFRYHVRIHVNKYVQIENEYRSEFIHNNALDRMCVCVSYMYAIV